jgi:hypothetical protein
VVRSALGKGPRAKREVESDGCPKMSGKCPMVGARRSRVCGTLPGRDVDAGPDVGEESDGRNEGKVGAEE